MREHVSRWGPAALAVVFVAVIVVGLAAATPTTDRADDLASQLRCPVCQSESVADSTATTAQQMRRQIDQFVAEGRSDAEIFAYYEARYGRWVRLAPPFAADTLLLWTAPVVALLVGVAVVGRRRGSAAASPVAAADRERLAAEIARLRRGEERS